MADSTLPIGSAIDLTPPSEAYGTWLDQVHRLGGHGRPQEDRLNVHRLRPDLFAGRGLRGDLTAHSAGRAAQQLSLP